MKFLSLPNEMIQKIFSDLHDLNEMLKCRLINRRCQQVVDRIRITGSLAVDERHPDYNTNDSLRFDVQRYHFTGELIGPTSVLFRTQNINFLKCKFIKKMLSRLKKMAIAHLSIRTSPEFQQFQTNINQLKELDQLQIGSVFMSRWRSLRLNHVRTLAILRSNGARLVVTAPALTKLAALCDRYSFEFTAKSDLTHLALLGDEDLSTYSLSNDKIEYVSFERATIEPGTIHQIILTYPALRELHVQLMDRAAVCEILKKKRIARNLRLVIYFSGFPVNDLGDVEQLFGDQTGIPTIGLSYIVANFERFHFIACVNRVDYSELLQHLRQLPIDVFFSKFIRIEQVDVGRTVDSEANLISFLKKCKLLRRLSITKSPLSQSFYENLPTNCANLEVLKIVGSKYIKLNFLFWFNWLQELSINQELDFSSVNRLIQRRKLRSLQFYLKSHWICLRPGYYRSWSLEYAKYRFQFSVEQGHYDAGSALKALFDLILSP